MIIRIGSETFLVSNLKNTYCYFPDNVLDIVLAGEGHRHIGGINFGYESRNARYGEEMKREWSALESESAGIKCVGESGKEASPQLRLKRRVGVHWAGQRRRWAGKAGVGESALALQPVLRLLQKSLGRKPGEAGGVLCAIPTELRFYSEDSGSH